MFSACALGARRAYPLPGSVAPLEGRGGVENYVEKWFSRQPLTPARGSAHLSALGALRCGEAVGRSPPGGAEPRESGGVKTAPSPLACWRRENERNYTKSSFVPPKGACNCQRPFLAAEGGGRASNYTKERFCKPKRGSAEAVNCASAPTRRRRGVSEANIMRSAAEHGRSARGERARNVRPPRRSARLLGSEATSAPQRAPLGAERPAHRSARPS